MTWSKAEPDDNRKGDIPQDPDPSLLERARQIARAALAADHEAVELNVRLIQIP